MKSHMFTKIAQQYNQPFSAFMPYAPIQDREAWSNLDEEWKREALALGEQFLHFSFPYISATDFMDFMRTGNRVRFEDKSFSKRLALSALVLAECLEDQGRFLDDIINGIFSICEESAWQLPPHNTYIKDAPQLLLPDVTEPVMDLFACETGSILGAIHYLLGERLDAVSPFITKRIRHEIQQRIIVPYCSRHFWWMGDGVTAVNNWTVWCTQNVLLSVFLTGFSQEVQTDVFRKACQSIDYFLDEYGTDGCCDEGAQYYRHAGLCLFNSTEILNAITGGAFSPVYQEEKIRNIAAYIYHVHIDGPYYTNFADCSPVAGRCSAREFLFALRTENETMAHFAAQDFLAGGADTLLLPDENNLYYRLQNGFTVAQLREWGKQPYKFHYPDLYYPSAGLFIARDDTLFLAVKAGDNDDSHNHNDTGSFLVYKNGQPLFLDVGVESYTKKTFSPQRYEIWTMQSDYHNLPNINGWMQHDGPEYKAEDVRCRFEPELCTIDMELRAAYPSECGLASYRRFAELQKGKGIRIADSFSFRKGYDDASSVILHFMTYEKPVAVPAENGLMLQIGDLGSLWLDSGTLLDIEMIPITDARLQNAWKHEMYRICIQAESDTVEMCIR